MGCSANISVKLALASILILCVYPPEIRSENIGCSFQGLQLDKCVNQNGEYLFLEPCCRALNLALRAGFHCLCSILATNAPQFSTIFSWSMSSCYISVPPMTICRGTMPITLPVPPYSPRPEMRPAQAAQLVPELPSPPPINVPSVLTSDSNSTLARSGTELSEKVSPISNVSKKENDASVPNDASNSLSSYSWLLCVTVYSIVLVLLQDF